MNKQTNKQTNKLIQMMFGRGTLYYQQMFQLFNSISGQRNLSPNKARVA